MSSLFGGGHAQPSIMMLPPPTPTPPPPLQSPVGTPETFKRTNQPSFTAQAAPAVAAGQTASKSLLGQ